MAEDDGYLEEERLRWRIVVVSIIMGLHDLLGWQIGVYGFLQRCGV